jgi:anti-sigma B factor antagonist
METEQHVDETKDDAVRTLRVHGEIDVATCAHLESSAREAIDAAGSHGVVHLDMSDVSFMDSSGLRTLMALRSHAADVEVDLVLRRPSRPVTRLLELTSLAEHFSIE